MNLPRQARGGRGLSVQGKYTRVPISAIHHPSFHPASLLSGTEHMGDAQKGPDILQVASQTNYITDSVTFCLHLVVS